MRRDKTVAECELFEGIQLTTVHYDTSAKVTKVLVSVRTILQETFCLHVDTKESVATLKKELVEKTGKEEQDLLLLYDGKFLEDEKSL